MPIPGDPRAWDALTGLWGLRVGVEAETAPTDFQALERRIMLKAPDSGIERVVLVLADSKRDRALLRSEGASLRANFPLQGRAALAAIRSRVDPRCNLIVLALRRASRAPTFLSVMYVPHPSRESAEHACRAHPEPAPGHPSAWESDPRPVVVAW